jgi:ariadne-1
MTCKSCSNHFCWICLGKWSEHNDNYKCNKPVEQVPGSSSEKLELERYVHFFERYHGHGKGMEYAREQSDKMKIRLDCLDSHSKHEIEFLEQAIKVLDAVVDCRRVLKYTYVMGCFLDQHDPKIQLFQHQQEMLEKNTEQLSHYTETKTFTESVLNTQMVNLKGVTENFKTLLLQSMEDGKLIDSSDKF